MPLPTVEELQKLGEIDPELEELLKTNPPPEFDWSNLPLFKTIFQSQEKVFQDLLGPPPTGVKESETHYTTRDGIQIRAKLYQPLEAPSEGSQMVVMFHGGGWCTGFPVMEEATCRNMVQAFGAVCVSCSYRLAPEFKFPTGVLDAYDALKWAAAQAKSFGADPKQGFVLGGTSAGANFTAVLAHRARDEGLQPPLTGVSYAFPFVLGEPNLPHVPEKYRDRAISYRQNESAPGIAKAAGEMLMRGYEPDIQDHDQFAAVLHSRGHAELPPSFFQLSGMDMMRDEGLIYAAMLEDVGVATRTVMYPGLPHDFPILFPQLKSGLQFRKDQVHGFSWLLGREPKLEKVSMFA